MTILDAISERKEPAREGKEKKERELRNLFISDFDDIHLLG